MEGGPLLSRSVARQLAARDQPEAKQANTPHQQEERVGFRYRRGCHRHVEDDGVSANRVVIATGAECEQGAGPSQAPTLVAPPRPPEP